jgi:hypothetical protein
MTGRTQKILHPRATLAIQPSLNVNLTTPGPMPTRTENMAVLGRMRLMTVLMTSLNHRHRQTDLH